MAQHELSGTQPARRANPDHVIVKFSDPVYLGAAQDIEDALRVVAKTWGLMIEEMYVAYDDGFGHLPRTAPKED